MCSDSQTTSDDAKPTTKPAAGPRRFGRDLTTGSIPRHLIVFSLPMLAGSALQTAYAFVNAIWVGQFLGANALAAATVSMPVFFALIALAIGLTLATNILISQHYGAGDMGALRRVVNTSTIAITVLSIILLVAGEVLADHLLRWMGTPADVLDPSSSYLRIFLLSMPLGFGMFLTRSMLQGIGDSTTPLYFLAGSLVLNAILDPILMLGWAGAPRLGLNGAAWASVVSQGLAFAALVAWLHRRGNPVAPRANLRMFDWATAWATIRIGLPTAGQQVLISISMVFVVGIINRFGEFALAGYGAASRVDQLAFLPAMTLSMAVATLAGQNIGAGRHDRVKEVFVWGCLLTGGITLLCSVLVVSVPRLLLRIFTSDPGVIDPGSDYLRIVGFSYLCFAIMFVSNGVINGSGHTLATSLIPLLSLWVVRVPAAAWLSAKIGLRGVWIAIACSFAVSMSVSLLYYASGWWRRPINRGRPAAATPEAVFGDQAGEA